MFDLGDGGGGELLRPLIINDLTQIKPFGFNSLRQFM